MLIDAIYISLHIGAHSLQAFSPRACTQSLFVPVGLPSLVSPRLSRTVRSHPRHRFCSKGASFLLLTPSLSLFLFVRCKDCSSGFLCSRVCFFFFSLGSGSAGWGVGPLLLINQSGRAGFKIAHYCSVIMWKDVCFPASSPGHVGFVVLSVFYLIYFFLPILFSDTSRPPPRWSLRKLKVTVTPA